MVRYVNFSFFQLYFHITNVDMQGSFGSYVKSVRDKLRSFQEAAEAAPDRFIRYEYPRLLDSSRAAMADFLKVPVEEVVFVANATTAVNAVLRNLKFKENDLIVYLDPIYGACEKTIEFITETTPAKALKVKFTYPISDDELVAKFEEALAANEGSVRIALFETVASLPGVRLPYERLAEVTRSHGVLSLIDGAHAVGHLPIDLTALQPDFFVSNCHK
jgi:selenocysteine lyase/cysteine desulfurase